MCGWNPIPAELRNIVAKNGAQREVRSTCGVQIWESAMHFPVILIDADQLPRMAEGQKQYFILDR